MLGVERVSRVGTCNADDAWFDVADHGEAARARLVDAGWLEIEPPQHNVLVLSGERQITIVSSRYGEDVHTTRGEMWDAERVARAKELLVLPAERQLASLAAFRERAAEVARAPVPDELPACTKPIVGWKLTGELIELDAAGPPSGQTPAPDRQLMEILKEHWKEPEQASAGARLRVADWAAGALRDSHWVALRVDQLQEPKVDYASTSKMYSEGTLEGFVLVRDMKNDAWVCRLPVHAHLGERVAPNKNERPDEAVARLWKRERSSGWWQAVRVLVEP